MSNKNNRSLNEDKCSKDVNLPIFLRNNGSSSTDEDQIWAYLQAPNWQNNPYESEQLHEQIHPPMKPNVSYFEMLPNELVQDLFQYLPLMDLFRSFYYLNQRYRQIIQYQLTHQAHLRLDFTNLSLREFDFICSQFNPKHVEALTVGDCDTNRIDETCSFGQIALFLYRYHLSQFSSLTSLRIINPYDNNQHILLLNQLREKQLKHLCIRFRRRSQKNLDFCLPFADTIESISLDQVTIIESSKLIELNFNQLQYFSIDNIFTTFFFILLRQMPRLQCLHVKLISHSGNLDVQHMTNKKFELIALTCLRVESYEITWEMIDLYLLSHMPNLRRLSAIGDYKTPMIQLVEQWKESFLKYTHHLIDFRFHVNIPPKNYSSDIEELLKPFLETFWQERKWYVAVDVKKGKNVHLYSLPCPRFDRILKTKCHVEHRLTSLPTSFEINHSYFNAIRSLVTPDSNENIETIPTSILYSNIHSLIIINRNDCDILLHRLFRLSSIRALTLIDSIEDTLFINLLNTMTQLESLRLMEASEKILLLLKENLSLVQCLQKRAIRKLSIRTPYSIKAMTNKTIFPIDKFIQVFGNSLEYLYWRKPSLSIEFMINNLPKLKNLTIVSNLNREFSTHELTQWIQEKTCLKTFVIKCDHNYEDDIWHFWL